MRLYLDLCAIQRPFDDQAQVRVRTETEAVLSVLSLCESGALHLIASGAHTVEIARCPYPERRAYVEDVLALATSVPAEPPVLRRAEGYHAAGMMALDALHLASAVEARADVFCTTDDALLRRGRAADTGVTDVLSPFHLVLRLSEARLRCPTPPDRSPTSTVPATPRSSANWASRTRSGS